jgi:1,4-alpha-glucan branching enzyme
MSLPLIIQNDEYLRPFALQIAGLHIGIAERRAALLASHSSLADFANGYLYFGVHKEKKSLVFREWAPAVTGIWLVAGVNGWKKHNDFAFSQTAPGIWELRIDSALLSHGSLYKLVIAWQGGEGERIPAWARRVVQDENTKIFSAQLWFPKPYRWKNNTPPPSANPLIYEAHVGMSSEEGRVSTYNEFRENVLPYIAELGYKTVQLMAVQEHPYYGSFGYHVSNFFAPSSRFGTPEELKELIDAAHGLGLRVIMDIVHSHAVKNESEGISRYDGTYYQFFHEGPRGDHVAWDSRCFNYDRHEVLHFLLSNCKYWLDEFRFDGFRFDGVTSMIYKNHGLGQDFMQYSDYFSDNLDTESLVYLALANELIHQVRPDAITIAEDMSGFPGMATPQKDGGIGFDFRLAMGIPDYWIKILKEKKDEEWSPGDIYYQLTNKRADEKVICYAESHDQALVGDKTIIFRLMDADMYFHMDCSSQNLTIDRGMALHKIIRLLTLTTAGGGYLNFMGNEFGHPEWIDFPRQGNNWSYHYARRQWHLAFDEKLRYRFLLEFDRALVKLAGNEGILENPVHAMVQNNNDQILAYTRGNLLMVVNMNPVKSFTGYGIPVIAAEWNMVLNSDDARFGGFGNIDMATQYRAVPVPGGWQLKLYLPPRTALVLKKS